MRAVSYSKNNQLTLLHRGSEFFPALVRAIDAAHAEIYLEISTIFKFGYFFIISALINLEYYI